MTGHSRLQKAKVAQMTDEWKPNPLTHIFPFVVGLWGWQVWGIVVGIIAGLAYVGLVVFSNYHVLFKVESDDDEGFDGLRKVQRNKWIIFIVLMLGISISAAEFVRA